MTKGQHLTRKLTMFEESFRRLTGSFQKVKLFKYGRYAHVQLVINGKREVIATNLSTTNSIAINGSKEIKPGEREKANFGDVIKIGYTRPKIK